MQLNSPTGKRLASRVFREAGSDWSLVRRASSVREDGVRVIDRDLLQTLRAEESDADAA
jgi:hypothetical protein